MNAVENDVRMLVEKELESANKQFPMFRSPHEGYAVILEEIEEAKHALENVDILSDEMWVAVKSNGNVRSANRAAIIERGAIHLATEAIQVAAMARKYLQSSEVMSDEK